MKVAIPIAARIRRDVVGLAMREIEVREIDPAAAPVVLRHQIKDPRALTPTWIPMDYRSFEGRLWRPYQHEKPMADFHQGLAAPARAHAFQATNHPLGSSRYDLRQVYMRASGDVPLSDDEIEASAALAAIRQRARTTIVIDGTPWVASEGPMLMAQTTHQNGWIVGCRSWSMPFTNPVNMLHSYDFRDMEELRAHAGRIGAAIQIADDHHEVEILGDLPETGYDFAGNALEGLAWKLICAYQGRKMKEIAPDIILANAEVRSEFERRYPTESVDSGVLGTYGRMGEADRLDVAPPDRLMEPVRRLLDDNPYERAVRSYRDGLEIAYRRGEARMRASWEDLNALDDAMELALP